MRFIVAVALFLCVACEQPSVVRPVEATVPKPRSGIDPAKVEVIAEFEGIRLYRITGFGRDIYVAKLIDDHAERQTVSTHWDVSCGKHCTEKVQVQTLMKAFVVEKP
jgi:hypothetical protein